MNTREAARAIAAAKNIDETVALKAIYGLSDVVSATVKRGGTVRLGSLGTFKQKRQKAVGYKDMKTGERKTAEGRWVMIFEVSRVKKKL